MPWDLVSPLRRFLVRRFAAWVLIDDSPSEAAQLSDGFQGCSALIKAAEALGNGVEFIGSRRGAQI